MKKYLFSTIAIIFAVTLASYSTQKQADFPPFYWYRYEAQFNGFVDDGGNPKASPSVTCPGGISPCARAWLSPPSNPDTGTPDLEYLKN